MYRAYRYSKSRIHTGTKLLISKTEVLSKTHGLLYDLPKRNESVTTAIRSVSTIGVLLRYLFGALGTAGVGLGGATYYAGQDSKFRQKIEENVPYSKKLFQTVHGQVNGDKTSNKKDELFPKVLKDEGISLQSKEPGEIQLNTVPDKIVEECHSCHGDENVKNKAQERPASDAEVPETPKKDSSSLSSVFITTMDHQHGISSIDLDISEVKKTKMEKAADQLKDSKTEESATPTAIEPREPTTEEISSTTERPVKIELTKEEIDVVSELVDQSALEEFLQACLDEVRQIKDQVIVTQKNAAESIHSYITKIGHALTTSENDAEFDNVWKITADMERESQISIDEAKSSESTLQEGIKKIQEIVKAVRKIGPSDIADSAEEVLNNVSLQLQQASEDIKKARNEFLLMDEYQRVLSKGESRLKEELRKIVTTLIDVDDKAETRGHDLESRALLIFALKKSEFLQKELEEIKLEEKDRVKTLIEKIHDESEKEYQVRLQNELARITKQGEIEREKRDTQLNNYYENEIMKQLKRQTIAHREHLSEVLEVQARDLNEQHDMELIGKLNDEKSCHLDEIEKTVAKVHGIESMITTVVDVEEHNRKARELWLAVQSLNSALATSTEDGRTHSLMPEIMAVFKAGDENKVVSLALSTIPETAAVLGISTEDGLKTRFETVRAACKRYGMVGDEGGSLWTYFLSYMRSFVVFNTSERSDIVSEVDVDNINTYDILAKAEHCMNKGDLEQAVKFMSLLSGLPRKLAKDWLRESRSYLETKQIADFLLAYAASEGVGFS